MADADDVRAVALSLPAAVEIESSGFDFRVAGKGFVWSYPERQPSGRRVIRTDVAVLYVGDEAEKQALLQGEPELFSTGVADAPGRRRRDVGSARCLSRRTATATWSPARTGSWRRRAPCGATASRR